MVILRRLLLTGISFVLIFILSGCSDPYSGKRPYDYDVGEGANGYNEALLGHCTFLPEKIVIKVDKDSDRLFNGKYDELVFIRAFTGDDHF